jgi:mannose/fructose/N-acetylgalactosamine-specific phosphotransferase system component IIC
MGLALSEIGVGLCLGLWTEILWLSRPPLGGFIAPNGGLAVSLGLLAWSLVVGLYPAAYNQSAQVLIFVAIAPLAALIATLEQLGRQIAARRAERLLKSLEKDLPEEDQLKQNLATNATNSSQASQLGHQPQPRSNFPKSQMTSSPLRRAPSFFWANFQGLPFTLGGSLLIILLGSGLLTGLVSLCLQLDPPWLWPLLGKVAPFMPLVGLAINAGRLQKSLFIYYFLGLLAGLVALIL